jgi:hypothetical protein
MNCYIGLDPKNRASDIYAATDALTQTISTVSFPFRIFI